MYGILILPVRITSIYLLYSNSFSAPAAPGFHSSVLQSLRALISNDQLAFKESLDCARLETVRSLSVESTIMNISPTLSQYVPLLICID